MTCGNMTDEGCCALWDLGADMRCQIAEVLTYGGKFATAGGGILVVAGAFGAGLGVASFGWAVIIVGGAAWYIGSRLAAGRLAGDLRSNARQPKAVYDALR